MIKILIADDQKLLRESLCFILNKEPDFDVIAQANNGQEAIELCGLTKPDIVLMDIEMPDVNGVTVTQTIKERFPKVKIIILTTFENPDNIMESFVAQADGYIVKNIGHEVLVQSVKCVYNGLTVIHDSVREIMIERFKKLTDTHSEYKDKLNPKEMAIVKLVARGYSNKEVAMELNYSEGTIKNYVSKILEKLCVSDRMQIAIFAMDHGLV